LAASSWRTAAMAGAIYGFVLGFVFMTAGYAGSAPLASVLLPFAGLGVVAAVGGVICAELGWAVRTASRKITSPRGTSRSKD
jgi:hypothetical protein